MVIFPILTPKSRQIRRPARQNSDRQYHKPGRYIILKYQFVHLDGDIRNRNTSSGQKRPDGKNSQGYVKPFLRVRESEIRIGRGHPSRKFTHEQTGLKHSHSESKLPPKMPETSSRRRKPPHHGDTACVRFLTDRSNVNDDMIAV
jgi:hypothetical protein